MLVEKVAILDSERGAEGEELVAAKGGEDLGSEFVRERVEEGERAGGVERRRSLQLGSKVRRPAAEGGIAGSVSVEELNLDRMKQAGSERGQPEVGRARGGAHGVWRITRLFDCAPVRNLSVEA